MATPPNVETSWIHGSIDLTLSLCGNAMFFLQCENSQRELYEETGVLPIVCVKRYRPPRSRLPLWRTIVHHLYEGNLADYAHLSSTSEALKTLLSLLLD